MTSARIRLFAFGIVLTAWPAQAAEAIVGRWLLVNQQVGATKFSSPEQLTLRVSPVGKTFEFAYSVPVNDIQFVSLRFSTKLDGSQADIKDANGKTIGNAKVTKAGSQYKLIMQGPGKPPSSGTLTVSANGKTLTSESDSKPAGQSAPVHTIQVFSRQ